MANPTFKITMENGGVIEGELYPDKAPQSVANFVELCAKGNRELIRMQEDLLGALR